MQEKSLRRIRRENIKRLEASLPPLAAKIARAELEHQFCDGASPETGVCDVPERRAQQLVTKFAQEHRMSSLVVSGGFKESSNWKIGGDQKKHFKKGKGGSKDQASLDEEATQARDSVLNDLKAAKDQLDAGNKMIEENQTLLREQIMEFCADREMDLDDNSDKEED